MSVTRILQMDGDRDMPRTDGMRDGFGVLTAATTGSIERRRAQLSRELAVERLRSELVRNTCPECSPHHAYGPCDCPRGVAA